MHRIGETLLDVGRVVGGAGLLLLTLTALSECGITRQEAARELAWSSYADDARYGCTKDCKGHAAGWEWAAANEVTDPGECGGKSDSFQEGCWAFTERVREEVDRRNPWAGLATAPAD